MGWILEGLGQKAKALGAGGAATSAAAGLSPTVAVGARSAGGARLAVMRSSDETPILGRKELRLVGERKAASSSPVPV